MKKLLIVLSLTVAVLAACQWAGNIQATPAGLSLSYSFAGCSGNQASYDLSATHPMGGTFTWSQGANPTSGPHDDPNYATTSFVKINQMIWVKVINKSSSEQVTVHIPNPCLFP